MGAFHHASSILRSITCTSPPMSTMTCLICNAFWCLLFNVDLAAEVIAVAARWGLYLGICGPGTRLKTVLIRICTAVHRIHDERREGGHGFTAVSGGEGVPTQVCTVIFGGATSRRNAG